MILFFPFVVGIVLLVFMTIIIAYANSGPAVLVLVSTNAEREYIEEFGTIVGNNYRILVTGVGPTNAGTALNDALDSKSYDMMLNLGTAMNPSSNLTMNDWYQITSVYDIDTPSNPSIEITHEDESNLATCGTTAEYSENPPTGEWDLVDLELYSLATIAKERNIPLYSYKYVSAYDGSCL